MEIESEGKSIPIKIIMINGGTYCDKWINKFIGMYTNARIVGQEKDIGLLADKCVQ